ncbi:DUF3237 domain-containing protein [Spiroplasma chrysopicola]|uniref:DUF3237 domain-containing protein n=1 Tax=Spiroplasma chrysopicola TaxID=216933 RepID=UPI001181800F|nr:DUF3237 domain-containing protein [Spiroplasma chrysopicola]
MITALSLTISAGTFKGSIYQLNPDGTVKAQIVDHGLDSIVRSLVQLKDGTILASSYNSIYQLNPDGTVKAQIVDHWFDSTVRSLVQLSNGTILMANSTGNIYQLNDE